MNKMQMAHDYFMKHENTEQYRFVSVEELASVAWKYAEAMQAEAEEREDKTRPKALLTKDKDGKCLHFNHDFGHKKCMDCGASLEEWQPDWSQAPEWAVVWVAGCNEYGEIENGIWFNRDVKPNLSKDFPCEWKSIDGNELKFDFSEPFNYQGNWQDSLRKRPQ